MDRDRRERAGAGADAAATRILGPRWAQTEGFEVREVLGSKRYRCPYCQGPIEPGTPHLVAVPAGKADERRHYHSPCWARHSGRPR